MRNRGAFLPPVITSNSIDQFHPLPREYGVECPLGPQKMGNDDPVSNRELEKQYLKFIKKVYPKWPPSRLLPPPKYIGTRNSHKREFRIRDLGGVDFGEVG